MGGNKARKAALRLALVLAAAISPITISFQLFVACDVAAAVYGLPNRSGADLIVVLGAGAGGEPSSRAMRYRIEKAQSAAKQNPDAWVVVTGAEAAATRLALVEGGIDGGRVLTETHIEINEATGDRRVVETNSRTVYENMRGAYFQYLNITHWDYNRPPRVVYVTNACQVLRAGFAAKEYVDAQWGWQSAAPATAGDVLWRAPYDYWREFGAYISDRLDASWRKAFRGLIM